jgi:hypothetical protein
MKYTELYLTILCLLANVYKMTHISSFPPAALFLLGGCTQRSTLQYQSRPLNEAYNIYRNVVFPASFSFKWPRGFSVPSFWAHFLVFFIQGIRRSNINPLNPELNPICYFLALLAHHFLYVSRIRVK